jgi:hypothetical protein
MLSINIKSEQHIGLTAHKSKFTSPKLLEVKEFNTDIVKYGSLNSIYNSLRQDTSAGFYRYFFIVTKNSKVLPRENFNKNGPIYNKLNKYVYKVFNKYHWKAGYLKKCPSCKSDIYMELRVFFMTNKKYIRIELVEVESEAETVIFNRKIIMSE